jgi:hypothetical protein
MGSVWGVYRIESRPVAKFGLGRVVPVVSKADLWPPFFYSREDAEKYAFGLQVKDSNGDQYSVQELSGELSS